MVLYCHHTEIRCLWKLKCVKQKRVCIQVNIGFCFHTRQKHKLCIAPFNPQSLQCGCIFRPGKDRLVWRPSYPTNIVPLRGTWENHCYVCTHIFTVQWSCAENLYLLCTNWDGAMARCLAQNSFPASSTRVRFSSPTFYDLKAYKSSRSQTIRMQRYLLPHF